MALEFIEVVSRQTPIQFYALTEIFKVEVKGKDFKELLEEITEKYTNLGRRQRRDLLKVLEASALTKKELEERAKRQKLEGDFETVEPTEEDFEEEQTSEEDLNGDRSTN